MNWEIGKKYKSRIGEEYELIFIDNRLNKPLLFLRDGNIHQSRIDGTSGFKSHQDIIPPKKSWEIGCQTFKIDGDRLVSDGYSFSKEEIERALIQEPLVHTFVQCYTNEIARSVFKYLVNIGYGLISGSDNFNDKYATQLFIHKNYKITYASRSYVESKSKFKQITIDELFNRTKILSSACGLEFYWSNNYLCCKTHNVRINREMLEEILNAFGENK